MQYQTGSIIQTFGRDGVRDRVVIVQEHEIIIVYPYGNPWRTSREDLARFMPEWENEGTVTII